MNEEIPQKKNKWYVFRGKINNLFNRLEYKIKKFFRKRNRANKKRLRKYILKSNAFIASVLRFVLTRFRRFCRFWEELTEKILQKIRITKLMFPSLRFVKKYLVYIAPATLGIIVAAVVFSDPSQVLLNLHVNGKLVGVVSSKSDVDLATAALEKKYTEETGEKYIFNDIVTYSIASSARQKPLNSEEIEVILEETTQNPIISGYGLYIDEQFVGASTDKEGLDSLVNGLELSLGADTTVDNRITIKEQGFTPDSFKTLESISGILGGDMGTSSPKEAAFNALNQLSIVTAVADTPDRAIPIDVGTVSLSYKTEKIETVETVLPFETVYELDSSLYEGTKATTRSGYNGKHILTEKVTYINGEEVSRETISSETTKSPQNAVIKIGTKKLPESPDGSLVFIYPFGNKSDISSPYGYRKHPVTGVNSFHAGFDLDGDLGDAALASASGTVTFVGWRSSYGYTVTIDHGNGITTLYAHLSKYIVKAGDQVKQGQQIGMIGATGQVTGTNLHFEVHVNGTPVDPLTFLPS